MPNFKMFTTARNIFNNFIAKFLATGKSDQMGHKVSITEKQGNNISQMHTAEFAKFCTI